MGEKLSPTELASQFMGLNAEGFRMFWAVVNLEWSQEDSDLEAQWFYLGRTMRPVDASVITALASAVESGADAAARKGSK